MTQTIIGYFDTRAEAEAARNELAREGISTSSIRILPEEGKTYTRATTDEAYDYKRDEGGFWASLRDLFLPEEDRYAYAEGMSRGGATLSLSVEEADYSRVADILERNGSIDVDELESDWKNAGWRGYSAETSAGEMTSSGVGAAATLSTSTAATRSAGHAAGSGGKDFAAHSAASGDEEIIPVVEEQLRVGKRQVDQGRVRIRSYVVETPVQEQVNLRSERVFIERRPVDRALTGTEAAFTDRVIEAEEHAEEAVISKETRIKEEIALRRQAEERTETVSDTVRRTEIEVEDERVEADQLEADRLRTNKSSSL